MRPLYPAGLTTVRLVDLFLIAGAYLNRGNALLTSEVYLNLLYNYGLQATEIPLLYHTLSNKIKQKIVDAVKFEIQGLKELKKIDYEDIFDRDYK